MIKKISLNSVSDLQKFVNLAWLCPDDVGVHCDSDEVYKIADAKSLLGLLALDFNKPLTVVTENEKFFKKIAEWIIE